MPSPWDEAIRGMTDWELRRQSGVWTSKPTASQRYQVHMKCASGVEQTFPSALIASCQKETLAPCLRPTNSLEARFSNYFRNFSNFRKINKRIFFCRLCLCCCLDWGHGGWAQSLSAAILGFVLHNGFCTCACLHHAVIKNATGLK